LPTGKPRTKAPRYPIVRKTKKAKPKVRQTRNC
jgi:hypothetical protein